ncbi:SAMHD1 [Symbiodinium sp. CCMP2592]|nr:SAMHD1 [Symbiodinium sp. CCMP2592]
MAALQYRSDHFMEAVHELVSEHAATFTFAGLANVLWSCAALESKPELSDLVAAAAVQLSEPLPADLVRMAWAFARLGKRDPTFIELLKRQVEVIPRLDSILLPDLAWALLKLQATDGAVLQKLLDQAGRVSKLDGMGWMTLILALRANQADTAQLDGLLSRCAAQMTGELPQQADSSILALDWLLQSVNVPEDAGRLRDAVATQVASRRLDNSNLEKMFSDEGSCLRLPASEGNLIATI